MPNGKGKKKRSEAGRDNSEQSNDTKPVKIEPRPAGNQAEPSQAAADAAASTNPRPQSSGTETGILPEVKPAFFTTAPGFAVVLGLGVIGLGVMLAALWKSESVYDEDIKFGIARVHAHHVLTSFTPMVAATGVTLRTLFLIGAGVGREATVARQRSPFLRAIPGIGRLYAVAMLGIVSAGACLIYISFPDSAGNAKLCIGIAATIWAGTLTHILAKHFRQGAGGET